MNALDEMWLAVMGEEADVPDDPQEVERILRAQFAPVDEDPPEDEGEDEAPESEQDSEVVGLLRGLVRDVSKQISSLEARLAKLEAQPAALPVQVTGPGEPTLDEQILELERIIKEKNIQPGSEELSRLMRLYQRKRTQAD